MRVDAHQHFWRLNGDYGWIQPQWPIHRDFLPSDLAPNLAEHGFAGSVLVQARQTSEESDFLLGLADEAPWVLGVVGWVDLLDDAAEGELERLAAHPKFVGVRHIAQDEPDERFLARPQFVRGVARLARYGLSYDLLVFAHQLESAIALARGLPEQPFVLDHVGKPEIAARNLAPWRERIQQLAQCENVRCKVSGLVTEADWKNWKPSDFAPYLEVVLEAFGPQRLMFGSDWPVCLLAASYGRVVSVANEFAKQLSPSEAEGFFGGNAARCYGL